MKITSRSVRNTPSMSYIPKGQTEIIAGIAKIMTAVCGYLFIYIHSVTFNSHPS